MEDYIKYFEKAMSGIKPIVAFFISILSYLLFPDKAYEAAAAAVGIAMLLDIITKLMALSYEAHGYRNAIKTRKIFSGTLWAKTRIKLISYLIIAILAGLSYRVAPLAQAGIFLGTVVYSVIFLREAQSILENLDDAGADVGWLIKWTKRKQDKILEDESNVITINSNIANFDNSESPDTTQAEGKEVNDA